MVARVPLTIPITPPIDLHKIPRIPSGSTLLDLVLGGGWAEGRVFNLVGDSSSGKTLIAIEACANFAMKHGAQYIRYVENEAAFDKGYAESVGLPDDLEIITDIETVEQLHADLDKWLDTIPKNTPCLYIVDSLDALSDSAEMDRDIGDGKTYGMEKTKALSQFFRRIVKKIEEKKCTLGIISQVRANVNGGMYAPKFIRSGGNALQFYSSQILWLSKHDNVKKTINKVERIIGTHITVDAKKNKTGVAFRKAEIYLLFNYGMDDETSCIDWLKKNNAMNYIEGDAKELQAAVERYRNGDGESLQQDLAAAVTAAWNDIEKALMPPRRKYE